MSEPETAAQGEPDAAATTSTAAEPAPEPQPEPQPEPWTPERVTEWNAYYDLYVVLGVLLLAFVVAANKINNSALWSQLRAGEVMIAQRAPLVKDTFSYTEKGRRWVDIPWLFDVAHAGLYNLASGMVQRDPTDPAASAARADQVGAGALDALARVLTALLLLRIRRSGPGLWWSAVCVTLALGAVYTPVGVILGGIALPGQVSPGTWGLLLLATELFLLHRAIALGRARALWALVPLFLVWANVDESFLIGLLFLAAAVVGLLDRLALDSLPGDEARGPAPSFGRGLVVLAACAAVALANPSVHRVYPAALEPLLTHFRPATDVRTADQISFFSPALRDDTRGPVAWQAFVGFYLAVVGIGLASFVVNRRRFVLGRFLTFALAAALWAYLIRYNGEFALVLALTLALNGQEWYHGRFGTQGRLGRGWALWSTGGRALTIVAVFLLVALALTGYGTGFTGTEYRQFGFGYDPSLFEFEAADYLKNAPLKGKVLNTTRRQGDALLWRAYPQKGSFIDSRHFLFPQALVNEHQEIRGALKDNDKERWKPLLDKYDIGAVMLDLASSPRTYEQLMQAPDWVPFYDDGLVVMFGRADAAPADVAYFKANRLDAEALAYRLGRTLPSPERPPTPATWMDKVFEAGANNRLRPQPHDDAARRWLLGSNFDTNDTTLPPPAQCLLAIREARIALAHKPDDREAFRLLAECYRALMVQEAALMQGMKLGPDTTAQLAQSTPNPTVVMTRFRERATALNFAIQTTPPPRDSTERHVLQGLNLDLFRLYMSANFRDLARDRLQAATDGSTPDDFPPEMHAALMQQLGQLSEEVKDVENTMSDLAIERQAGPIEQAAFAMQRGAPGLALQQLEEADRSQLSPALVKPQLIDLYCDTGQPDKAAEVLSAGSPDDPALGTEPGVASLRQGLVYFLLGNYEDASLLWERRAIPQLRFDRSERVLAQLQTLLRGNPKQAVITLDTIPSKIGTQAAWEYDLALCRLESGTPDSAAEHFTKALELSPDMQARGLIAYYLEKMGKPVPPSTSEKEKAEKADTGDKDKDKSSSADKKPDGGAKAAPAEAKPEDGEKPAPAPKAADGDKDKSEGPKR